MDMDEALDEAVHTSEQTNCILIPVNGALSAERALHAAAKIAHASGATLVLFRAVPPLAWAEHLGPGALSPQEYQQLLDDQERAARGDLEVLAGPLRQRGLDVRSRVECGDPRAHLLSAIDQLHPLLVVLAATDQPTSEDPLAGNAHRSDALDDMATNVVARDGVPVLVVPPPAPEHREHVGAGVSAQRREE